jgi:hypothetical protein
VDILERKMLSADEVNTKAEVTAEAIRNYSSQAPYVLDFRKDEDTAYLIKYVFDFVDENEFSTVIPETYQKFLNAYGFFKDNPELMPSISFMVNPLTVVDDLLQISADTMPLINKTEEDEDFQGDAVKTASASLSVIDKRLNIEFIHENNIDVSTSIICLSKMSFLSDAVQSGVDLKYDDIIIRVDVDSVDKYDRFGYGIYRCVYEGASSGECTNIVITDPVPKSEDHKTRNITSIVYGRDININDEYKVADYRYDPQNGHNSQYEKDISNNVQVGNDHVKTLLPFSGYYEFEEGTIIEGLYRLTDVKGQLLNVPFFTYDNDVTKQGYYNIPNSLYQEGDTEKINTAIKALYEKISGCFTVEKTDKVRLNFDLKYQNTPNGSFYDWGNNISCRSIETGAYNYTKNVYPTFVFDFGLRDSSGVKFKLPIMIQCLDQKGLDKKNAAVKGETKIKYFVYNKDINANALVIPALTMYWGCFAGDSKLKTADGKLIRADSVTKGDKLISEDGIVLTVGGISTGKEHYIYEISTDNGKTTRVSKEHILRSNGKNVFAANVRPGDILDTENGTETCTSAEKVEYNDTVYNFIFEDKPDGVYLIGDGFVSGDFIMQNNSTFEENVTFSKSDKILLAEYLLHKKSGVIKKELSYGIKEN